MVYNSYQAFEFDVQKSRSNKVKHGIDFLEAQELWRSLTFEVALKTTDEKRWAVIGTIDQNYWTAIITRRNSRIRIISVRRSRDEEKQVLQGLR